MDRAAPSYGEGCAFDSLLGHHEREGGFLKVLSVLNNLS